MYDALEALKQKFREAQSRQTLSPNMELEIGEPKIEVPGITMGKPQDVKPAEPLKFSVQSMQLGRAQDVKPAGMGVPQSDELDIMKRLLEKYRAEMAGQ